MAFEIRINKKFLKELARLPEEQRKKIESFVFHEVTKCHSLSDVRDLKKA